MSQPEEIIVSSHDSGQGTRRSYTIGFILSVLLTLAAYVMVEVHSKHNLLSYGLILGVVIGLALIQLVVQLVYFLHLSHESKPRWNLTILVFAVLVVIVLVGGSIWIMYNLNYHMTSQQLQQYLNSQDGL